MLPALLLIGRRPWILPGPLFLLWPLVGLGWLIVAVAKAARWAGGLRGRRDRRAAPGPIDALHAALGVCARLSGLSVEVSARGGRGIMVRFI